MLARRAGWLPGRMVYCCCYAHVWAGKRAVVEKLPEAHSFNCRPGWTCSGAIEPIQTSHLLDRSLPARRTTCTLSYPSPDLTGSLLPLPDCMQALNAPSHAAEAHPKVISRFLRRLQVPSTLRSLLCDVNLSHCHREVRARRVARQRVDCLQMTANRIGVQGGDARRWDRLASVTCAKCEGEQQAEAWALRESH